MRTATRKSAARISAGAVLVALAASARTAAVAQDTGERLGAAERDVLATDLHRGRSREVLSDLDELVTELPQDGAVRSLRALVRYDLGDANGAVEDARAAVGIELGSAAAPPADKAFAVRTLAGLEIELGRAQEAQVTLRPLDEIEGAAADPENAWVRGRAALESGDRAGAKEAFRKGAETKAPRAWEPLLAQARCQRALGRLEAAAQTLASADLAARKTAGPEPDVLAEWASVKFEGYGEVGGLTSDRESAGSLYREALRIDARHEDALLGLVELGRVNWNRSRESPGELLHTVLANRPDSIRGHLARTSFAIDDGDLKTARESLARLESLAPGRRDVRVERAALLWIEHERDPAKALLAELAREDAADAAPEREVARHLVELYRFEEALPFAQAAVERDPSDARAWRELGRAQANTGDEDGARVSLARSESAAEGRQDAWRANTLLVLDRMKKELVPYEAGPLRFLWPADGASVLATYYVPFYLQAREDLARRYGFTPEHVKIEVFQRWEDFSVRSTGFQGFPALGVCFGPVVTAVSPLSELRGQFSWARTAWHEFTHVVHLGISHNRCPRWVTEGLATWEELARRSSWTRNMRRELLDARANGAILPIRELNGAFRGPRVLFAYYQSGLLCEMLIDAQGFPSMVRLLEAFDVGKDLDAALGDVFGRTPEELDREFLGFVDEKLAGLAIEPRWSEEQSTLLSIRLGRRPPADDAARAAWADDWCRVAWGRYWVWQRSGGGDTVPVDVDEALRVAATAGELPPRGHFLRGELAVARGDRKAALDDLEQGFAAGGEDYRARMALGTLLVPEARLPRDDPHAPASEPTPAPAPPSASTPEIERAIEEFRAAERVFPGYDDPSFSAELSLAALLDAQGRGDEASEARLRWLAYNADNFEVRVQVAQWLDGKQRFAESARLWGEANEVDPFRRGVHVAWGRALARSDQRDEALREFEVAREVPSKLDGDLLIANAIAKASDFASLEDLAAVSEEDLAQQPKADALRRARDRAIAFRDDAAAAFGEEALVLIDLGRADEARASIEQALALDADCPSALEARARLDAASPGG